MHDAFELCELISADVLGEEPVTALLLHGERGWQLSRQELTLRCSWTHLRRHRAGLTACV